jgi:hypothetical protein
LLKTIAIPAQKLKAGQDKLAQGFGSLALQAAPLSIPAFFTPTKESP